jgi:hypothetical protein
VGGECPLVDSEEQQQGEWVDACRIRLSTCMCMREESKGKHV